MAPSVYVDTKSMDEWRDRLRSIKFWLDGYRNSPAYRNLEQKLDRFGCVHWNVGVGPTCCFTRAISGITREAKLKKRGPFDHVIEVDMKRAAEQLAGTSLSINDKLHLKVAEQLGLLDQEYDRLLEKNEELQYYTYNTAVAASATDSITEMLSSAGLQIIQKLWPKKYLLVVENLDEPINPIKLHAFTEGLWLPHPSWHNSFWLVSTTSRDVYDQSKPDYGCVIESFTGDDILMLTLYSLKQAAKYISSRAVGQHGDEEYWHHVAVRCFHYATMLLIPHSSKADNNPPEFDVQASVDSDTLIHHWAAHGMFTAIMKHSVPDTAFQDADIYKVGNVILEAFREYSLLQLPFIPANQDDEATKSAAHFFAYHGLIAEHLTLDELCEGNNQPGLLERRQWISFVGDQGWHLSREWLMRRGSSGPAALSIKHCSQQSKLFKKLESDHFFANLPCLCILDLFYNPLKSLPPSIYYLQKLQYLSLRGCYNLTSPFSFPGTEITLSETNSCKNINLLCFDLSYSNISTFHCDFFNSMPILQELLLVKCSNLEELPPSVSVLSSLRSFTFIGATRIKKLSLRGLRNLEYIDIKELGALEEIDLSATAIKELPDNIPNLPKLRRLLLMGVPSLRRFPWHKLQRLPDVFWLDQCSDRSINHSDTQVAQVCISDSRLFYSFRDATVHLVRAGKLLKSFNVRVTSCKAATTRKIQDQEDMVTTSTLQAAPPAYDDVNRRYLADGVSMVSMDDVPPFQETERHVEISAVDLYPHGLNHLVRVTKSMSMWDDTHVFCLDDLSSGYYLEECMLRRCHQMVQVFKYYNEYPSLKKAYVSNLKSLTCFSSGAGNFSALKHLVLEHCPRLEGVVPRYCKLPSLETLDILFCYNLKAIFSDNRSSSSRKYYQELPCLRRIHLQELPLLRHLHIDSRILSAPKWEELYVRGCWSLRHLPRFDKQPDKAVTVSGERAWWAKLRWDDQDKYAPPHRDSYIPRLPPALASSGKRFVIQSYLR